MNIRNLSRAGVFALTALASLAMQAQAAALFTIKVKNTGAALTKVPVTFGQPFRPGDFKATQGLSASAGGTDVPVQVDVKCKHDDGTIRHAVVTVMLDALAAGETKTIAFEPGAAKSAAPVALADLLASSFDAKVSLNVGGTSYEASAKALLAAAKPAQWLSGDLVSEWIVGTPAKTTAGAAHPHLAIRYNIRAYQGFKYVRVDAYVENDWAFEPNPQGFTYDAAFTVGSTSVYTKAGLKHAHHARWRRIGWVGGEPSVTIEQDRDYILTTQAIPYYDKTVKIAESAIAGMPADFEPMTNGNLTPDMGDGGAQAGIGPSPNWTAKYIISMDPRARANVLANGTCMGAYPVHYRDKATDQMVNLDTYPYATDLGDPEDAIDPVTKKSQYLLRPVAQTESFRAERAHDPAAAYYPYLFTGDYFYMEELLFWANWKMAIGNPTYRDFAKGLLKWVEVRGQAWGMRNLAQAAYIAPDNHPLKAYFRNKLENNIKWYTDEYVGNPKANTIGYRYDDVYDPFGLAPWQDDFFTWAMSYVNELGFTSVRPFLGFKTKFVTGRMTDPGYCWLHASAYSLQIGPADKSSTYGTLAEIYKANFPGAFTCTGVAMDGYPELGTGYGANMQPALAAAVDFKTPGASDGWTKYGTRVPKQDFSESPQYAIVPKAQDGVPEGLRPGAPARRKQLGSGLWVPGSGAPLAYTLDQTGRVIADVFDSRGRLAARLDQGVQKAGEHHLSWSITGAAPVLPQGVCIVRLRWAEAHNGT